MKSLREILASMGGMTDKNTAHTYGDVYEEWFIQYRLLPVHVLELGCCVFGGGSLLAFAEYFQTGTIYGIEQNCKPCVDAVKTHGRIKLIEADAYDPFTPSRQELAIGGLDIIIDDASHNAADQLRAAEMYFHLLHSRGMYICEDTSPGIWTCPRAKKLAADRRAKIEVFDMNHLRPKGYDNVLAKLTHLD